MNFKFPLQVAAAAVVLTGVSIAPVAASDCSSVVSASDCEAFGRLGQRVSEGSEANNAEKEDKKAVSEKRGGRAERGGRQARRGEGRRGGERRRGGEGRRGGGIERISIELE